MGQAHLCLFLRDSASYWKMLVTNTIQSKYSVLICMCGFLRPTLQHVVETKIDAKITRKKWLNNAFTTQKPRRNHLEPIEHSTDQPVSKLLHNVAHAGLEIPSTSPMIPKPSKQICRELVLKLKQGETLQF